MNFSLWATVIAAAAGVLAWMTSVYVAVRKQREDETKRRIEDRAEFSGLKERISSLESAFRDHRKLDDLLQNHETRITVVERVVEQLERVPQVLDQILAAVARK